MALRSSRSPPSPPDAPRSAPMAAPTAGASAPVAASPSATATATATTATRNDDLPPLPPPSSPVTADPCVDRIGDCARYRLEQTELTNGTAEVLFGPNGAVDYVRLDENVCDTLTGEGIERRLRRVKIAPFFGRSQSVRRFFTID